MTASDDLDERHSCSLLLGNGLSSGDIVDENALSKQLEQSNDDEKIEALQHIIQYILQGHHFPLLLMSVIYLAEKALISVFILVAIPFKCL